MATYEIEVSETKTHLSKIIQRVASGERFFITRRGQRVAELRPVMTARQPLERGCAANPAYQMAADFDEPLSELEGPA